MGRGALALAVLLAASQGAILLGGRTLLPIAPSAGVLPDAPYAYRGPTADTAVTVDPEGALNVEYALDAYAVRALRGGAFPFWNPHQGLGQPFLANPLTAILYPVHGLHLVLPPAWWDVVFLVNWWLAAVFLYGYLRSAQLGAGAALVAGVAVLGSGYFQVYLPLREVPAVAAWWPLLLWGIEIALRRPASWYRHMPLAVGVYCTITAGQPSATFFSLLAALVYGLVRVLRSGRAWQALANVAPGALAGLLLAAPMWVNFVDYAWDAYSVHPRGSSSYGQMKLPFASLATFVLPNLYGRIHTHPFGRIEGWVWDLYPGWFPAVGLFLALVGCGRLIRARSFPVVFFTGLSVVVVAKIWGFPGFQALGRLPVLELLIFPRYGAFLLALALAGLAAYGAETLVRAGARPWLVWLAGWCTLVIALFGLGLSEIRAGLPHQSAVSIAAFAGLGLAWAILAPLALGLVRSCGAAPHCFHLVASCGILLQAIAYASNGYTVPTLAALSAGCLLLYAALAAGVGLVRPVRPVLLFAAVVPLLALCSWLPSLVSAKGLAKRHDPLRAAPYLEVLSTLQASNLYRSYSLDGMLQPNFAAPFGISSLNTAEALLPMASARFLRRYLDPSVDPISFGGNVSGWREGPTSATEELFANRRYFDLAGVRYVTARKDPALLAGGLVPRYADRQGVTIWERPSALPRVFLAPVARVASSGQAALDRLEELPDLSRAVWIEEPPAIESDVAAPSPGQLLSFRLEPNDVWITYDAASAGILTLTDSHAEGWRAELDGREVPVLRVDGVFRGVRVPGPGRHRVRFWYRPPLWAPSLGLAGAGALLLLGADRLRRRVASPVDGGSQPTSTEP